MNELRFSIQEDTDAVRIKLAGHLEGADVETVYQAWQRHAWDDPLRPVIVDITSIKDADEYGRALLVIMHRFGAQIIANSCESSAIAQTLVNEPVKPASSIPSWFGRLIAIFQSARRTRAQFPPQAEMICHIPVGQHASTS